MIEKAIKIIKGIKEEGARYAFRPKGELVQLVSSTVQVNGTWWESPTPIVLTPTQHTEVMERINVNNI